MNKQPVYVTQPLLPDLEEFIPYLEQIWASKQLTNGGDMHRELERQLAEYLGIEHIALFNSGTIALLTALQALGISGEVITTPYSFVATAHSLLWNAITPVFVDIDPVTLNLDSAKIEAAITAQTSAIMPVHCYGTPCATEAVQQIADRHGLKVIYDAAHAFGIKDAGGSILRHGNLSVLSFHATKVFNTFEGGAIICPDAKTKKHIDQLKNFGFVDEVTVVTNGINGKMSEINAAFGLLQLRHIDQALARRQAIARRYREALKDIRGIRPVTTDEHGNNGYFPVLLDDDYPMERDALYQHMRQHGVHVRRYFYPLISDFPMYQHLPSAKADNLPVASRIANQVLCLPIYPALSDEQQSEIIGLLRGASIKS